MEKIYIAYGSNMNTWQMRYRCPNAKEIGTGKLKNHELLFKGAEDNAYATIEPKEGAEVDVVLWKIRKSDEKSLDRYEGYPRFYTKETVTVQMEDGSQIDGMAYVMDRRQEIGMPSKLYFQIVAEGYVEHGIDMEPLIQAVSNAPVQMEEQIPQMEM